MKAKTNKNSFYEITNVAGGEVEILLYGYIGTSDDAVDYASFKAELDAVIKRKPSCIVLNLNCGGGSVIEAMAIYDLLADCGIRIKSRITGMAASIASVLFLLPENVEDRQISPNSRWMSHRPSAGLYGDATTIESGLELLKDIEAKMIDLYVERTGQSKEVVSKWMVSGRDNWFTADQCQKYGIGTKAGKPVAIKALPTATATEREVWALYSENFSQSNMDKFQKLVARLAAVGIVAKVASDAEEADYVSAIEAATTAAIKAKDDRIAELEATLKTSKDNRIKAILKTAVEQKKIKADQVPSWTARFEKDEEFAQEMLDQIAPAVDINARLNRGIPGTPADPAQGAPAAKSLRDLEKEPGTPTIKAMLADTNRHAEYQALYKAQYGVEIGLDEVAKVAKLAKV